MPAVAERFIQCSGKNKGVDSVENIGIPPHRVHRGLQRDTARPMR
jgi:hypothetical protein